MKKALAVLVVLAALGISIPALAQSGKHLSTVNVDIWPEYDKAAVLVIYHISLLPATTLPAKLELRIPAQAEVWAVAYVDPSNSKLQVAPYDRSVNGSTATLTITANSLNIQVEYYDTLMKDGPARHIIFDWAGDYAVDTFAVAFQQPVGATNLVTDPALTQSNSQDGTYFESTPQALAEGQSFTLTVDYQKATDALSTTGLPVRPVQPLATDTPGRVTMDSALPWVLAGIGAALIVVGIVGGYYMWKSGTRHSSSPHRKRHSQLHPGTEPDEIYCPQCGKRALPGDGFCRTCGSRLRKEEKDETIR